jgi:hypothetical protein
MNVDKPTKFTLSCSMAFSLEVASKIPICPHPALFTTQSTFPNSLTVSPTAVSMVLRSVTSHLVMRRREAGWRELSSDGAADGFRRVATTFQPLLWKRRAAARPMPEEQPVMNMVLVDMRWGTYGRIRVKYDTYSSGEYL